MTIAIIIAVIFQNVFIQSIAILTGIIVFIVIFTGRKANFKLEKVTKNTG